MTPPDAPRSDLAAEVEQARDPVTGQFAYDGDFDRLCKCGHTLGVHTHGGFDCLVGELPASDGGTGEKCKCRRFRGAALTTGEPHVE